MLLVKLLMIIYQQQHIQVPDQHLFMIIILLIEKITKNDERTLL